MARPNFFNENRHRTFPFLEDFQEIREVSEASLSQPSIYDIQLLPNDAIVDFGTNLGVRIPYDPEVDSVYLYEVRRQQSNFVFEFRCTAPGLEAQTLSFVRSVSSTDYETSYAENLTFGQEFSQSLSECGGDADWSGYLTTGTMESLALILTSDGQKLKGEQLLSGSSQLPKYGAIVEPALIRSMRASFVRAINLANAERTRAENPADCKPLVWPFVQQPVYIERVCITGDVRFVEGYNTVIDQDELSNEIVLGATPGGGAGEACEEVPLFAGEQPAAGQSTLSGGPTCNEVIRSINGVGGRVLDLLSGPGVSILSEPDNNRIIVDFDMNNLALCFDEEPFEESLCPEESITDPNCGPAA